MKGISKIGPGGIRLVMNPNDHDTPCMVYFRDASATYHCAIDTGEVEGYELEAVVYNWLCEYQQMADDFDAMYRVID